MHNTPTVHFGPLRAGTVLDARHHDTPLVARCGQPIHRPAIIRYPITADRLCPTCRVWRKRATLPQVTAIVAEDER